MSILDRLYCLEIEFHRISRTETDGGLEAAGAHTSYAVEHNYEALLQTLGIVNSSDFTRATSQMMRTSDPRDVQAAFHFLSPLITSRWLVEVGE